MKLDDMYQSRFLWFYDLARDLVLTIDGVAIEEIGQGRERRPVLSFSDHWKVFILSEINARTIAALYGDGTDSWRGKRVTLYAARVPYRGGLVNAVRIRDAVSTGAA